MRLGLILTIFLTSFPVCSSWAQTTLEVTNAEEFVEAIGSDRVIHLAPGEYELSALVERAQQGERLGDPLHVQYENTWNGPGFVISNVHNLTIVGPACPSTNPSETAHLLMNDSNMTVIWFQAVEDVTVENVMAGHGTQVDVCSGNVFNISDSSGFVVRNSILYGSGATGLMTFDSHVTLEGSEILNCTALIVESFGGTVHIRASAINHNAEGAFEIYDAQLTIEQTAINLSAGDVGIFLISGEGAVTLAGGAVNSTTERCLTNQPDQVELDGTSLNNVNHCPVGP